MYFLRLLIVLSLLFPSAKVSPELEQLVTLFIEQHPEYTNDKDYFILVEYDNTDGLSVSGIEEQYCLYKYTTWRKVHGVKVFFYGPKNQFFKFDANSKIEKKQKELSIEEQFMSRDPDNRTWKIVFFDDGSINRFLTAKEGGLEGNNDDIVKLFKQADTSVEKEWLKNHSIDGVLVDVRPKPLPNEQAISDIISRYEIKLKGDYQTISADFVVDENGIATFVALENDKNADEYRDSFIKICKDIESSIIFAPAVHKGEKVKCHYIVLFSMYFNTQY